MACHKAAFLVCLAAALALGVVWQGVQMRTTGYRLQEARAAIHEEEATADAHRAQLSKLRSPQRIVGLVSWLELDIEERPATAAADIATLLTAEARDPGPPPPADAGPPAQGRPAVADASH